MLAKGKTRSEMSLAARRRAAMDLFSQGFSDSEVAQMIEVTEKTAGNYRRMYEEQIRQQALNNPGLLKDLLANTFRMLDEQNQVIREAWRCYYETDSNSVKGQMLNVVNASLKTRASLLGVLGVKQEYFIMVQNVKHVQDRLLDFMRRELCSEDREKLIRLIETELSDYVDQPTPPQLIEASLVE